MSATPSAPPVPPCPPELEQRFPGLTPEGWRQVMAEVWADGLDYDFEIAADRLEAEFAGWVAERQEDALFKRRAEEAERRAGAMLRQAGVAPASPDPGLPPPFPLDVLPPAVRRYVEQAAEAVGAPPDFVAVPLLGLAEGVIGSSRSLVVKDGFEVAPGGWYAVVGEPGTAKSPAMRAAMRLVDPLEEDADRRYREERDAWEARPKEERGAPPRRRHYWVGDSTLEALADALSGSAGVCQFEDELLRRLRALDAYRKGGDRQAMLALWGNAAVKIARRTTGSVYVPFPVAPLVGATQPGVLAQLRGEGAEAAGGDGWVSRFCFAWPEADVPDWSEASVEPDALRAAQGVFAALRLDRPEPLRSRLSPAAYAEWKAWHAENAAVQRATGGLEREWAAKAPRHLARLALVLHALADPRSARVGPEGERGPDVTAGTMLAAVDLLEYFRAHFARVLPAFGGAASGRGAGLAGRVLRAVERAGDWVATTALHRALGGTTKADDLAAALTGLQNAGAVERREVATGARPRVEWRPTAVPGDRRYEDMKNSGEPGRAADQFFISSYLRTGDGAGDDPPSADLDGGPLAGAAAGASSAGGRLSPSIRDVPPDLRPDVAGIVALPAGTPAQDDQDDHV